MAFYPCLQAVSTPAPSTLPSINLLQSYTTSGASNYTVTENGTYMFIVSNSLSGSRSITLPQGRTAIVNEAVETTYGMTVVIVELQANDVVGLSATPDQWLAFSKQVYKIEDLTSFSVVGSQANNDGHYTYSLPSAGQYLLIGLCFGRDVTNYYDESDVLLIPYILYNDINILTLTKICYGNLTTIPEQALYGYDGGGVCFLALSVS